jgi:hypothetical protein
MGPPLCLYARSIARTHLDVTQTRAEESTEQDRAIGRNFAGTVDYGLSRLALRLWLKHLNVSWSH